MPRQTFIELTIHIVLITRQILHVKFKVRIQPLSYKIIGIWHEFGNEKVTKKCVTRKQRTLCKIKL
jgi:hypothetical protein